MTTSNVALTASWSKIVDDTDLDFLLTWESPLNIEVATTSTNSTPTVEGHHFSHKMPLNRSQVGAGFVWARVIPSGGLTNLLVDLSKSTTPSVASLGASSDTAATWYSSTASLLSVLKLAVAAFVGAGSRVYTYTNGKLTSVAWTLFGVTRTKTYTYTSGVLTAESDWV